MENMVKEKCPSQCLKHSMNETLQAEVKIHIKPGGKSTVGVYEDQ